MERGVFVVIVDQGNGGFVKPGVTRLGKANLSSKPTSSVASIAQPDDLASEMVERPGLPKGSVEPTECFERAGHEGQCAAQ
jgi:hypothetical protein